MVDVHCHILPGLDDGAKDVQDAINLAQQAVNQGITTIIATPHHRDGTYDCTYEQVLQAVESLNNILLEQHIPLTVLPGQEVHFFQDILSEYESQNLVTLAQSSYLLIELPATYMPDFYDYVLHELIVLGVTPIIAHPERNAVLLEDDQLVDELIEMGVLFQITSASILGKFGSKIQNLTLKWCKQGIVHFIASDAHNLTSRSFDLLDAYTYIGQKLGRDYVDYYKRNASLILNDGRVESKVHKAKKSFKFWKR